MSGLELAPFFSATLLLLAGLLLMAGLLLILLFCLELLVNAGFPFCFTVLFDDFDDEEVVEDGGVGLNPNMLDMLSWPGGARKFPLLRCRSKS